MDKKVLRVVDWEKHQHYKRKNKNYNNEQKWFMVHGRELLRDMRFMQLTSEERDFLIIGCWAVGSQDNGFLPNIEQHAFWIRREINEVERLRNFLFRQGWLEEWSVEEYNKHQNFIDIQNNSIENKEKKINLSW